MKKVFLILLVTLSALNLILLIYYALVERSSVEYYYTNTLYCGDESYNLVCGTYGQSFEDKAALHSLSSNELTIFWILSFLMSSIAIVHSSLNNLKGNQGNPLDILNKENEYLKKQIENNELKQRLKGFRETETSVLKSNLEPDIVQMNTPSTQERNLITCPKCTTVNDTKYSFCSQCGYNFEIPTQPKAESHVKYTSGILIAFAWSTILSVFTVIFYVMKNNTDIDKIANNAVQGVFARPIVVLLMALIFSSFFKTKVDKISKFNTSTKYIMGILTLGEMGRWFVILGA